MPVQNQFYNVRLGDGRTEQWDQKEYDELSTKLYEKYPDAEVVSVSEYGPDADSEVNDYDSFQVSLPDGRNESWSKKDLDELYGPLKQKYPDARVIRVSPVGQLGEKIKAYNALPQDEKDLGRISGQIYDLEKELDGMGGEKESTQDPRVIQGSIAQMQASMQEQRESPESSRRREIMKQLDELKKEKKKNTAWQRMERSVSDRSTIGVNRIRQMQSELDQTNPESAELRADPTVGLSRFGVGDRELSQDVAENSDYYRDNLALNAARQFYKDAKKTIEAPSKYGDESGLSNYWRGIKDNAWDAVSVVSLAKALGNMPLLDAVTEIQKRNGENANIKEIIDNSLDEVDYLSPAQKEMLHAFVTKAEAEQMRSDDLSRAYQAGQSFIKSVGYMTDFIIAGGVGDAAAKGAFGSMVKNTAEKTLARVGAETLYGIVKSTAMMPIMASSYTNILQNLARFSEDGSIDLSSKAKWKAFGDTYIEVLSETIGAKPLEALGIGIGKLTSADKIFEKLAKTEFGKWGKAFYDSKALGFLRAGGWNDGFGEIFEEYTGDALRSLTGVDKNALADSMTWENLGILAMSFLPMTLMGGGVNTAKYGLLRKNVNSEVPDLQNRLAGLGFTPEQITYATDVARMSSPENAAKSLRTLSDEMWKRGATQQDVDAAAKFVMHAAQLNMYDGYQEGETAQMRQQTRATLDEAYGKFWRGDENVGETVDRVTLPDGRQGYLLNTDETGEMIVKMDDGSIAYTSPENGAEVSTFTMDQYLDSINLADRAAQEEAEMQAEQMLAQQQFADNVAAGTPVPMGTPEAPVSGTVVMVDGGNGQMVPSMDANNNYLVETPDGTVPMTADQLAEKWGIQTQPRTTEQKEADAVAELEAGLKRRDTYNSIQPGTPMQATLEGIEEPVNVEFVHATYNSETNGVDVTVRDVETGKTMTLPESAIPGIDQIVSAAAAEEVKVEDGAAEDSEAPMEKGMTPRDSKGEPLPMRVAADGTQKVDEQKLWDRSPEEWVIYNDGKQNPVVDSRTKVTAAIQTLSAQNEETTALLQQEMLGAMDQDKIDLYEKTIADNNALISRYNTILESIDAREAAAEVVAEDVAAETAEAAETAAQETAAEQPEAQPAEQTLPTKEQLAAEILRQNAKQVRLQRTLAQRDMDAIRKRIDRWLKRTGSGFDVIESRDQVQDPKAARAIDEGQMVKGWYDTDTKRVMVYLPNILDETDLDKTVIHELVSHRGLRGLITDEGYDELCDRVWDELMDGEERERFLRYNAHIKADPNLTEEENAKRLQRAAADEFIAHLAERIDVEPTLWERFVAFVRDLLGLEEESRQTPDQLSLEDLSDLLHDSLLRYETMAARGKVLAELSDSGIASNREELRFSVKYAPKTEEEAGRIAADISEQVGVSKAAAKRWVKSETSLASVIAQKENQPYLDYAGDDRYTAIKENSDYPQGTVDFNNICRKRIAFTEMYQRLQKAFPNVIITGEDLANIRNIMKDHGLTVACGLCYVEDRRQLLGEIAKDFIDNYNSNFEDYASRGGETKRKNAEKFRGLIGEDRKEDLSIYDLITLDGSTRLYAEHPGIYEAFQAFNNARGQQSGNLFQGYAEYKREILKWSKRKVKSVNDNGGLRVFSYSDFEAHHLIDLVQIIQDCARMGVKVQGYTKVPAFARAVAETGIKLNRSLIPLGDTGIVDGKLAYDPVEGIDVNDGDFLESNDNVGNILIGINDEQIRLAMADPFIHYIIPYHSNQREVLRALKQTGEWKNYKAYQNEVDADGKTTLVNIYTEVIGAAEAEGKPIRNERQFVERFLEVCREKGLTPRFEQFLDRKGGKYVYTPGYYKLLLDFKMFDEKGRYLPQKPVVAKFDDAFNAKILSDYVKGEREKYEGDLDGVYGEIVEKLGLAGRTDDRKTGEQILGNILESIGRKAEEQEQPVVSPGQSRIEEGNRIMFRILEGIGQKNAMTATERELNENGASYGNEDLMSAYGLKAADLTKRGDVVTINRVAAEKKGQGAGTKFMTDLTKLADKNGWTLALTPTKDLGATSVGRLKDFYKRFGFKENKGHNTDFTVNESMIRRTAETESQIRFRVSNVNERIFISNAEKAVQDLKMDKATPEQWKKTLEKNGGLKAAEDKWLGLSTWLDGLDRKTVTKQEILDFIAENQIQIEEQHYSEDVDIQRRQREDIRDMIGKGRELEEIQAEIDELVASEEYTALPADEQDDWLMDQMKERYGDDFEMGYYIGPSNTVEYDIDPYSFDVNEYITSMPGTRPINSTRKGYTTEGLRNLHEIALTVPTAAQWNVGDMIHFGDAGNGRAISWARFGDTWTSKAKDEAEQRYREADKAYKEYRDEIIAKYALQATGTKTTKDLATPEENERVKELQQESVRLYHDWAYGSHAREKVLVIDEIQSKRHQEAREQGGYKDDAALKKAQARSEAANKAYDDYMASLIEKYGDFNEMHDKITPEENAESQRLYRELSDAEKAVARNGFEPMEDEEYRRLREEQYAYEHGEEFQNLMKDWMRVTKERGEDMDEKLGEINAKLKPFQDHNRELIEAMEARERVLADEFNAAHKSKIPAAPFEKNWPELTMKRMLRYAAENGYDTVAWTTGDQQAERYGLGGVLKDMEVVKYTDGRWKLLFEFKDGHSDDAFFNKDGIVDGGGQFQGKHMSEVIGKDLADRIINKEAPRSGTFSDPSTADLYDIKGDGLKVGGEGMKGFYDDILVRWMNKYGKKWGVKVEDIDLPALGSSEKFAGSGMRGLTMHSVPVTKEMKESVMEGQLMFRKAEYEREKEEVDRMTVYHGSGADFDRFDHSHMGEGEGSQVYGWGTYVTTNRDTGMQYAVNLGGNSDIIEDTIKRVEDSLANATTEKAKEQYTKDLAYWNERLAAIKGKRHLYSVEIPEDSGENYIHWDEPITVEQSRKIMAAVRKVADKDAWGDKFEHELKAALGYGTYGRYIEGGLDYLLGNEYNYATDENPGAERNAKLLNSAGIVGIQIPIDRNGGKRYEGSNYVIFNDKDLEIVDHVRFRITPEQDREYMSAVESGDMDAAQEMVDQAAEAAGYTIRGYHGTTHNFTIFDRRKGNAEGNWGKGFYFTNNLDDAEANYGNEDGPDLQVKIERLAENMEWMDGYEDMDYDTRLEEARKMLTGDDPHVISAAIRMSNPVVFNSRAVGPKETFFDFDSGYNPETDEYEGEESGLLLDFINAWNDVLWDFDYQNVSPNEILDYADYGGLTASQLEQKAREILDNIGGIMTPEGDYATGEFLRQVFERMGFDGIVDANVNIKFGTQRRYGRSMDGMDYGTTHFVAFQPNQIKQADPVTRDDQGNVIPLSERFNPENEDIRFRIAPNGKESNLTDEQWEMVRTPEFKAWFGDWEKAYRINKLRESDSAIITGSEVEPSEDIDQYKKNAREYGKTLRGDYTNADTGKVIRLYGGNQGGLHEVLGHDYKNIAHLQSVAAIPQIIEKGIYIDSQPNEDTKNPNIKEYEYYVCGLKIGGEDYTVKAVVGVDEKGDKYYDHKLSEIEKGKLLDELANMSASGQTDLSSEETQGDAGGSNPTAGGEESKKSPLSEVKDKRLISLLQVSTSKIIDENGEPRVVYHGSNKLFDIFEGGFFTSNKDVADSYASESGKRYDVFLNIRKPIVINNPEAWNRIWLTKEEAAEYGITGTSSTYDGDDVMEEAIKAMNEETGQEWVVTTADDLVEAMKEGDKYDGVILNGIYGDMNDGSSTEEAHSEYIPKSANQVKSAETTTKDENGNEIPIEDRFTENPDMRFRIVTDPLKVAELEAKPKVKVYRSMQEIDGKLYPPMSARVGGELRQPTKLGVWEESEERPDLADEDGNFKLDKGNKKSLKAAYAPYFHTRRSPLNEQFSEAYNRPNLVIVEGEIPESELTSGYTAEKSKKSVGEHDWPSGKVSNALAKKGQDTRKVILSRWFKPVRVVPNGEVADMIMERLGDSKISFPNNVVTPGLREELKKRGAKFSGWQGNKPLGWEQLVSDMDREDEDATRFRIAGEKNQGVYRGKPFWSGSVNLLDGEIEEVHTYEEAAAEDFHHSAYFSDPQVEKIDNEECGFFWIEDGDVQGDWRYSVPQSVLDRVREQIQIREPEDGGDIRFSLRGLIGAENDQVAMDNLAAAERMEKAGINPHTIWVSTGWERGKDGKWRNEIPDAKPKKGVVLKSKNVAGEILDAPELFASYPQLESMPVDLEDMGNAGAYNSKNKRIAIDRRYNTRPGDGGYVLTDEGTRTLLHELQHAIQNIEGFARGASGKAIELDFYKKAFETNPELAYFAWFVSRRNSAAKLIRVGRQKVLNAIANTDTSKMTDKDKAALANVEKYLKDMQDGDFGNFVRKAGRIVTDARKAGSTGYRNSAGEVEARNVETRSRLTTTRATTPPSETEDVDRSAQNVRFRVANENQRIFVSNAERAVERIDMDKATPEQWKKMIEKNGGLKAGEDKWLGLSQWLDGLDRKTVTKQEIADFIKENQIQIEEQHYAEDIVQDETSALQSYQAEFDEVLANNNGDIDAAWKEMIDRYGDDFDTAFTYNINPDNGVILEPHIDWNGYLVDAAMYLLDQRRERTEERINTTRLHYTTEGLENRREIALTVPTIEPWNESDEVHFGDAGEGRAVAWIRFGETEYPEDGGKKRSEFERVMAENDEWYREHPEFAKYGVGDESLEKENEERKRRQREALEESDGVPKRRVLVIDEIQSKRHQEGREKGYRMTDKERAEVFETSRNAWRKYQDAQGEYSSYLASVFGEAYDPVTMTVSAEDYELVSPSDEQTEHINELANSVKRAKNEWQEANSRAEAFIQDHPGAIPAAPFEKNWHELAMKRMLRLAAEEGYDYVAWTTGEQQADRYNLGSLIQDIEVRNDIQEGKIVYLRHNDNNQTELVVDENGNITDVQSRLQIEEGTPLRDVVGKELAVQIMGYDGNGSLKISGDGLRIGGEGMKGFYDDILPRFMNKYGKQWGVKVADINLPNLEGSARTMHSVPVTEEMKKSVMEGQTMFRITPEQDAEYMRAAQSGDLATAQRMVNEAAEGAMPESMVRGEDGQLLTMYHGTPDMTFTVFAQPGEDMQGLIWMTDQKRYAEVYAEEYDGEGYRNEGAGVYKLFANIQNPINLGYIEDVVGSDNWNNIAEALEMTPEELFNRLNTWENLTYSDAKKRLMYIYDLTRGAEFANLLKEKGYDGAFALEEGINKTPTYAAVFSYQVKSAEDVEYGDNGDIIPLSQRFRPSLNDIRFRMEENGPTADQLIKRVQDYGLRGIMDKESVDAFWSNALSIMPEDMRRAVVDSAFGDDLNLRRKTRDEIAKLAYRGFGEDKSGLLRYLADRIREEVDTNQPLTDNDLLYMLWRSANRYPSSNMLALASDIALRRRLGIGEYADEKFPNQVTGAMQQAEDRIAAAEEARDEARTEVRREVKKTPFDALNKAMTAQRAYDQETVNAVVALAKDMIKKGNIPSVTAREMARLMTIIKDAAGRRPATVKESATKLLDFMVDHTIGAEKDLLEGLLKVRTAKVREPGVDTIAKLDLHAQNVVNAFRDNYKLSEAEISAAIESLEEKLGSERTSETAKEEITSQLEGLQFALRYATDIAAREKEIKEIRQQVKDGKAEYDGLTAEEKNRFRSSLKQEEEAAEDMIRSKKIEEVTAYRQLRADLAKSINEGAERALGWLEQERQRVEQIHHYANSDLQGISADVRDRKLTGWAKLANSQVARFVTAPLANLDQMTRTFGRRSPEGRGYLWNWMMGSIRKASDAEKLGLDAANERLNEQVQRIFDSDRMTWNDLYAMERRMPKVKIKYFSADGKWVEDELTQGNMLYIYMVNKMADGRMKLRQMNIDDAAVEAIKKQLDPRFVELADWIQEEFLPSLRDKYNEVHKRLFGTSMASIENYFPLRILKGVIQEKREVGDQTAKALPSDITGAIVKRTVNNKQLNLTGTDAFSTVIEHIQEMEHWAAYAEASRDFSTLLKYKHFENQVKQLDTIFGSGKDLFDLFWDTASLAVGAYRPVTTPVDRAVLNLAKGVTAAKISFRIYTALKQFLSWPAFLADVDPAILVKNTLPINIGKDGLALTYKKNWDWAMENLPNFKKRVESRKAGNDILEDTALDANFWKTDVVKWISQNGMFANAFVDALTVSIGARSMYETRLKRYLKEGFSQEEAEKKAKMDAVTLFNETQQSSEKEFMSTMQANRTGINVMFSAYRNSSMGYQRQLHQALRTLGRMSREGYKEESIEFMTKQLVREGLTEDQAAAAAESRYKRAGYQAAVRVAVFGWLAQFAWNLGSHAIYLLFGDDPEEKKAMLKEDSTHALVGGWAEGLAAGNLISEALNMFKNGENLYNWDPTTLPLMSDIKSTLSHLSSDWVSGVNDLVYLAFQIGLGTNPQTISDAIIAIIDACNGDMETAKEAMFCIMRILQVPQSQLDQLMIDEIGMTAKDASTLSYTDVAKRYTDYKMLRNAPATQPLYKLDEELRKKREKSAKTTFKKKVNERKKLKEEQK